MPITQSPAFQFLTSKFTHALVRFRYSCRPLAPIRRMRRLKKLPTCKPDPVPARGSMRRIDSWGWPSFIWPLYYYRDLAAYPPALLPRRNIGRAALDRRYTWHFSMQGLPAPPVTWRHRGLLPHIFILTHPSAPGVSTWRPPHRGGRRRVGSYFLWHSL